MSLHNLKVLLRCTTRFFSVKSEYIVKPSKINNKTELPPLAILVWLLGASFFFAEYFARVAPAVMAHDLMRSFQVNAFSLGSLSASFYYAYVAMQLPVGMLVDRYGPRLLLTFAAWLCGISALLFAESTHLFVANIARFTMGFGAAFAFVGTLKLARTWFPSKRFGFFAGATQAIGMLGAAVGEGPVSILVVHAGWRSTMLLIGFILLAISILIFLIVRDKPFSPENVVAEKKKAPRLLKSLYTVLQNPQTWINGLFVGFLYAPTAAFAELWGPSYLHQVDNLSLEVAAGGVSFIFIGWAIAGPIAGWLSDKMQKRKPIMILSALCGFIFMGSILYLPNLSTFAVYALLFCYGLTNVGVGVSYAVAAEINPNPVAGTSMSFANMASVIIGAFFQPIIGAILDLLWKGQMQNGVRLFSTHDFQLAMIALPLCFVISLVSTLWLKESFQKH